MGTAQLPARAVAYQLSLRVEMEHVELEVEDVIVQGLEWIEASQHPMELLEEGLVG